MGEDVNILRNYFREVRSEIFNNSDEENIYFYNMLCHLNFEDLKCFSGPSSNYSFLRALSPKKGVSIIDKNPYIGTQTFTYTIFNDFYLFGAPLNPEIAAHNYIETKGPLGFWWHDTTHQYSWNLAKDRLKACSLYETTIATLMDIYMSAVQEPHKKERKKILDFLFVLIHGTESTEYIARKFENKKDRINKHDILSELESFGWPIYYEHNRDLGSLIASNGYPEAIIKDEHTKTKETLDDEFRAAINKFRRDMFRKLHDIYGLF